MSHLIIAPSVGKLAFANTTVPAGNTNANSTAENAFSSSYTIPANSLTAGSIIRVNLYGVYGTTVVAPTLTGKLKLGSTVMLNTGALTTVVSLTNAGWWAEALMIVQTTGASGSIEAQGYAVFATAATTGLSVNIANTAAITIDTTAAQALTVTTQWSAANAANTITLRQAAIEVVRA